MDNKFERLNKELQTLIEDRGYMFTDLDVETDKEEKEIIYEKILIIEDKMKYIMKELDLLLND